LLRSRGLALWRFGLWRVAVQRRLRAHWPGVIHFQRAIDTKKRPKQP